jgi:hypothetical protein
MASRKLQRLVDQHGVDVVCLAAEKIISQEKIDEGMTEHLKVRRFDNLLARPELLLEPMDTDPEQVEIEHANIRGAKYYE